VQYEVALDHYQRAVSLQPSYHQAHCNMGVIFKERGELELAISSYEKALIYSPNFNIAQVRQVSGSHMGDCDLLPGFSHITSIPRLCFYLLKISFPHRFPWLP